MLRFVATDVRRAFRGDDSGSVAIIFAAVLIPVIGIAAAAIDYGRASGVQRTLQSAVASAAQAASAHLYEDKSVIEGQVKRLLSANLPKDLAELPHRVIVASDRSKVEVTMATSVPTTLMGVLGVHELPVEASGVARPVATVASLPGPGSGAGAGDAGNAAEVLGRALGAGGQGAATFGGLPGGMPGLPQGVQAEALQGAAREIAGQLQRLKTDGGGRVELPPEAREEILRMMREVRRGMR